MGSTPKDVTGKSKSLVKPGYSFIDKMNYWVPTTLQQAIQYLSERNGQALFTIKDVSLHSTRTFHNSAGERVADILRMTIRTSYITLQTFDLEFHFDSYDWTFPPDLILVASPLRPSLRDIGLDDSWDASERSCLSKVLTRVARILQHEERLKVAMLQNERIQFEYSTLHEREEMDCAVVTTDGPTRVLFAVPFDVSYRCNKRDKHIKAVVKVQYTISALVENNVTSVQSNIEFLTEFKHPEIASKLSPIGFEESIHDYIEDVRSIITQEFEKKERAQNLRKTLIDELARTFKSNILECDTEQHGYIAMLFNSSLEPTRQEVISSVIITVFLTEKFPDDYPKIAFSSPALTAQNQTTPQSPLGGPSGGGSANGQNRVDLPTDTITMPLYSPRWDAKRMVEAIWEFMWEEIPRFNERAQGLSISNPGSSTNLNASYGSLSLPR